MKLQQLRNFREVVDCGFSVSQASLASVVTRWCVLCGARRFDSAQQAVDYLGKIKVSGDYQFEAVLCGARAAA